MFEKFFLHFTIGELVRNKSIQNFIFLAIIQLSNVLISIISMPLLIQRIGVDQFGFVNLALSVVVLANIFVNYGFNLSAPRDVAINHKNKKELSSLVSNIFSAKLILAFISCSIILVGIFFFDLFREYKLILIFSLFMVFSEATMPLWFFQGMEKMKLVSIANIFSKLLFLAGIVLFITNSNQVIWVNFILGASAFGINIMLVLYIHYQLDIVFFKPKLREIFRSIQANTLFFLSMLASHISINGGLIILSFFANSTILGMFSLAEKIGLVLRMIPVMVIQATYPNASKLYTEDRENFFRFCKKIAMWASLIGLFISGLTYLLAPFIVKVLSRKELPEAVDFLRILGFLPFMASLNVINVILFLVKGQKKLLFNSSWVMCIYMIIASVLLTDLYGGLGLSFGLLSAEWIIFSICVFFNLKYNREDVLGLFSFKSNK